MPTRYGDVFLGVAGSEELMSPFGRVLNLSDVEFSRQERTVDGTLRKDIRNVKTTITLDYEIITTPELRRYEDLYRLHTELSILLIDPLFDFQQFLAASEFFTFESSPMITFEEALLLYPSLDGINFRQFNVLMQPIDNRTRLLVDPLEGLWTGVSFVFEEI